MIAAGHLYDGRFRTAIPELERLVEVSRAVEDLWIWEMSLFALADMNLTFGRTDRARTLFEEMRPVAERHGTAESRCARYRIEAALLDAEGKPDDARAKLDQAVEASARTYHLPDKLDSHLARGRLLARAGDPAALEDLRFCREAAPDAIPQVVGATV